MASIYELNGRVPVLQAVPFGLQHVLAMFVANITPIIILANVAGVNAELSAALIQNCMVVAGIGTLVQLYPVWRIGSRLPIVMGISFTFLSLAIFIGSTMGMGTLMGAVIIGGIVEGLLGLFVKYWVKLVPPIVAATVVTAIGFSLLPIGANSFAGGQGAADFGAAHNWIIKDAKTMLKSGNYTVQEVSETLHFANQSFFGKYFKEAVGCSPMAYKERVISDSSEGHGSPQEEPHHQA